MRTGLIDIHDSDFQFFCLRMAFSGEKTNFRSSLDEPQSPFGALSHSADFAAPRSSPAVSPRRVDWERHAALPLVVTGYVQAVFNLVVLAGVLYGMYWFACAIQQDIDLRAEHFRREVVSEIQSCAREYAANRCEPGERIPAMQKTCEMWKNCIHRSALIVVQFFDKCKCTDSYFVK